MLDINAVSKRYPNSARPALDQVSLRIESGSIRALIGPNGAGKSTLVRSIVGLQSLDSGTISLNGIDLDSPSGERARTEIGYASQEVALYPVFTARQNLQLFAELRGLRRHAALSEVSRVTEAFLLGDFLNQRVSTLSGGQARRVHNAIAVLGTPAVVLLDEPTAGVDPTTREAVLDVVTELSRRGTAVLYATHYLTEVETLDAPVTLLNAGRVQAEGTVSEFISKFGSTKLVLRFDDGTTTSEETNNPENDAAAAMRAHLDARPGLVGVEIFRPSLDEIYLSLTAESTRSPTDTSSDLTASA